MNVKEILPALRPPATESKSEHGDSAAAITNGSISPAGIDQRAEQDAPVAADALSSVARRTASGAWWVLLASGALRIIAIGSNFVLARLLNPADFGLVSFAMILIGAFTLVQDLGVPAAIIYGKRDIKVVGGTALTINVLTAASLFGVTALISPLLIDAAGDAAIAPVALALALGLVISSLSSVQNALLVKDLAFRRKLLPDVIPMLASALVSIGTALLGFGVWSLVLGYLAKSVAATVLLWVMTAVRPVPEFKWSIAVELVGFGKHVSLASVVGFAFMNVDYLIVGRTLGTFHLGIYTMAFVIAGLPSTLINQVLGAVTFPAYARLRGQSQALNQLFADVFRVVAGLSILAGIALFVAAPLSVRIGLGEKWHDAVIPLQILTIFGIFRGIESVFAPLYKAIGRPNIVWRLSLLRLVVLAPLLLWSTQFGIGGVAVVQVLVVAVFVPLNGIVIARLSDLPVARLWQLSWPPLAAAAAAGLVIVAAYVAPGVRAASTNLLGAVLLTVAAVACASALLASDRRLMALASRSFGVIASKLRGTAA